MSRAFGEVDPLDGQTFRVGHPPRPHLRHEHGIPDCRGTQARIHLHRKAQHAFGELLAQRIGIGPGIRRSCSVEWQVGDVVGWRLPHAATLEHRLDGAREDDAADTEIHGSMEHIRVDGDVLGQQSLRRWARELIRVVRQVNDHLVPLQHAVGKHLIPEVAHLDAHGQALCILQIGRVHAVSLIHQRLAYCCAELTGSTRHQDAGRLRHDKPCCCCDRGRLSGQARLRLLPPIGRPEPL